MAAFNFPSNPNPGDEFTPPGGPTYVWNPPRWNMKGTAGGGSTIISGPVDPTASDGSSGDWYINTSTGQWFGPRDAAGTWPPAPAYRPRFPAPREYFVRNDGNDANTGLANTPAGAFATIQRAITVVQGIDLFGDFDFNITVLGGFTYAPFSVIGPFVGNRRVTVRSSGTDFLIDATAGVPNAVRVTDGARLLLFGASLKGAGSSPALLVERGAFLETWNPLSFRGTGTGAAYIEVRDGATLISASNIAISASAAMAVLVTGNSTFRFHNNFNFTNSPSFSTAVAVVRGNSVIYGTSMSPSTGTVTGKKFICDTGGGIDTNGGLSAQSFPGSVAGDLIGTGFYDGVSGVRERLSADRTYWVDGTLGNDSNDGLTQGNAFQSIQRAVDVVWCNIDTGYRAVTINLAGQTFNQGVVIAGRHVGLRTPNISGIQNSTIWTSAGRTLYCQKGCVVNLTGIEIRSTGDSGILAEDTGTIISIGAGMRFGACSSTHMWAYGGGKIFSRVGAGGYTISGGSNVHWRCDTASIIDIINATITISAPVTINYFANSNARCLIACNLNTFVNPGNSTGAKFLINPGGQIDSGGANQATYLPGTTAGVVQTNGIWS